MQSYVWASMEKVEKQRIWKSRIKRDWKSFISPCSFTSILKTVNETKLFDKQKKKNFSSHEKFKRCRWRDYQLLQNCIFLEPMRKHNISLFWTGSRDMPVKMIYKNNMNISVIVRTGMQNAQNRRNQKGAVAAIKLFWELSNKVQFRLWNRMLRKLSALPKTFLSKHVK